MIHYFLTGEYKISPDIKVSFIYMYIFTLLVSLQKLQQLLSNKRSYKQVAFTAVLMNNGHIV